MVKKEEGVKVFERIKTQRDTYVKLLKDLLGSCKNHYKVLDIYYDDLQLGNASAQIAIILATSSLTFVQSYYGRNDIDSSSSSDEFINDFLRIYTLCVSTGTGVTLAIMRFLKLDEKRENVHDLKIRFLDLHNRIRYQLDILRPWKDSNYFNSPENNYFYSSWRKVWMNIESEYKTIIDIKKVLFVECNKLVYGETLTRYKKKIYADLMKNKKYDEKFDDLQLQIKEHKNKVSQKKYEYEDKWDEIRKTYDKTRHSKDSMISETLPSTEVPDKIHDSEDEFQDVESGSGATQGVNSSEPEPGPEPEPEPGPGPEPEPEFINP